MEDHMEKKEGKKIADKMIKVKESEYLALNQALAEMRDKNLRLHAEFDNFRKRLDRERMDFVKYANEGIIAEFLTILDDLERSVEAAKANHQDYTAFLKGIEMVMAHIYEILKKNNVKPVEAKGKKFDPHCHEVLMMEETDECDDGTILEEFQKGYVLSERVVRTAKVKVAKKKNGSDDKEPAKETMDQGSEEDQQDQNEENL